jgi:hypothetical protein
MLSAIHPLIRFTFFGNYFYGLCVVALSIEATLQQGFPLGHPLYFLAVFACTVLYYTYAYIHVGNSTTSNPRIQWYRINRLLVRRSQWLMAGLMASSLIWLVHGKAQRISDMRLSEWIPAVLFPVCAMLYYGLSTRSGSYNLRSIGWLKPFVIGFIWAGVVTIYPVLFQDIIVGAKYAYTPIGTFLFIKNFMFVSVLCIMFDIKDYAMDYNAQLKTFVVKVGLRRTLFQIIIPLCIAGLFSFLIYGFVHGFHPFKLVLNVIPFVLLIIVAYSMHNRKSVLYYLIIIDGLMLAKAVCGSIAMIYF